VPDALLVVAVDPQAGELRDKLVGLIDKHGLKDDVIQLGSVWDQLPFLYGVTSVYCTPSVMEGFGMSAQEAAATGRPVVASNLVPFVCEYLIGPDPERVSLNGDGEPKELEFGQGGVVVPADFVDGFAEALTRLLKDDNRRKAMGDRALDITVPYFTWRHLTENLLRDLGVSASK
jgi:glycosyltransferase involved in cell wall biosynthesis